MSLRPLFWAMILSVLPNAAMAQDAPAPQSSATPITPAIPSDFQLPPGEGETQPQQQPQARPSAAANPIVQELPVQPTPTAGPSPAASNPEREQSEQRSVAEPADIPEPVEVVPPESENSIAPAETQAEISSPSSDLTDTPTTAEPPEASGNSLWFALVGMLAVLALAVFAFMRRRRTAEEAPVVEAEASLPEAPKPALAASKTEPAPPGKRDYDPATLVSIKPRSSQLPQKAQTPKPPTDGLVSTNLAAKLREQRAVLERAEKAQKERAKPAPPAVNRSISFDW